MESSLICWSFLLSAAVLLLSSLWAKAKNSGTKQRPPGPTGWPVVGNIFDLGTMPHQTLQKLSFQYGPVLWLQLGSVNTKVIQSAKAAAELFQNHDLTFSDRKVPDALTALSFGEATMGLMNYGPLWRVLRRLCSTEILNSKRLNETANLRRKCVDNMVKWIQEDAESSRSKGGIGEVDIHNFVFLMSFNVVSNLTLSKDLLEPHSKEGSLFLDTMSELIELAGKPNIGDFIPILKPLDPIGIKRNTAKVIRRLMEIVDEFVKERIRQKQSEKHELTCKDFLDTVMEYQGDGKEGPDRISARNLIFLILELFISGTETTSMTTEWALSELLRCPDEMRKAKEELDRVIGPNKKVEETDIHKLPFLQAIVKETLRLHPVVPLLLPRNSVEDCIYMGYHIPKDTQVFVNTWAIGRDPESWIDPLTFKPGRFLDKNIEYIGQSYEFIPFGAGRRACVGYPLGHRVVHLAVATLVKSFDWKLNDSTTPETMNMNEKMGMTLRKLVPLRAIPTKRRTQE